MIEAGLAPAMIVEELRWAEIINGAATAWLPPAVHQLNSGSGRCATQPVELRRGATFRAKLHRRRSTLPSFQPSAEHSLDDISDFIRLFRYRNAVITGGPGQSDGGILRRPLAPGLPTPPPGPIHVLHDWRCRASAPARPVLKYSSISGVTRRRNPGSRWAPGGLNIYQRLLKRGLVRRRDLVVNNRRPQTCTGRFGQEENRGTRAKSRKNSAPAYGATACTTRAHRRPSP